MAAQTRVGCRGSTVRCMVGSFRIRALRRYSQNEWQAVGPVAQVVGVVVRINCAWPMRSKNGAAPCFAVKPRLRILYIRQHVKASATFGVRLFLLYFSTCGGLCNLPALQCRARVAE